LAWLTGWSYRKSHIINDSAGSGTDYQVKVIVNYGAGVDSGATVYVDGKCETDFSDIRFTDDDGDTLLDYWMEDKTDSNNAVFWVEVADDLSSSPVTIYVYYGNNLVSTTSNGEDTFPFFDNFDTGSLDATKWNENAGGSLAFAGSVVTVTGGVGTALEQLYAKVSGQFGSGYALRSYAKLEQTAGSYQFCLLGFCGTDGSFSSYVCNAFLHYHGGGYADSGSGLGESYELFDIGHTSFNAWFTYEVRRYTTGTDFWADAVNPRTSPLDKNESRSIALAVRDSEYQMECDWVAVRKFVASEPAHGAWGAEEALIIGGDSSLYYYWSKPKLSNRNRLVLKNVKKFLEALTAT